MATPQQNEVNTPFIKAKTEMLKTTKPFDIASAFEQGWHARGDADKDFHEECDECGGTGERLVCPDDLCQSGNGCIHGDGYVDCYCITAQAETDFYTIQREQNTNK